MHNPNVQGIGLLKTNLKTRDKLKGNSTYVFFWFFLLGVTPFFFIRSSFFSSFLALFGSSFFTSPDEVKIA